MSEKNIKYPVKFRFKIILENILSDKENEENITKILNNLEISYVNFTKTHSSNKKYTSYSASVTVNNKETLYKLYKEIKEIKNFKFAI